MPSNLMSGLFDAIRCVCWDPFISVVQSLCGGISSSQKFFKACYGILSRFQFQQLFEDPVSEKKKKIKNGLRF